MKSPFPGMDPFLEQNDWQDVHAALSGYIRDALQPQLAGDLYARLEATVYIDTDDEERISVRKPDVFVGERDGYGGQQATESDVAVLDEPVLLSPLSDPTHQRTVVIYDSAGSRIVTAIEVLSPRNKTRGPGLDEYLTKRQEYLDGDVNLVEIDLLRCGDWTQMIGNYAVPRDRLTPYRISVAQSHRRHLLHYPIALQSRLPTFPVPLRSHDKQPTIDLQSLFDRAYEMGRYDRIDYAKPIKPLFTPDETKWVNQQLTAAGRIPSGQPQ